MEPTSTHPAGNGANGHGADDHGCFDGHSFVSKEAEHVPAHNIRDSDGAVLVTRTIEQTVDDGTQARHVSERPIKKKCEDFVSHKTKFFLAVAAAIILIGFGAAYLGGLFQLASSLDGIGAGLGRLQVPAPVTIGTTVTETVFVTASASAMAVDIDNTTSSTIPVATPAVQIKDAVQTETVWMNNRRGDMPFKHLVQSQVARPHIVVFG
ncbi:hypothetical protein QBC39DRAFT_152051 [Podospora conica]|nr:hypothetical protein QBC39DRAFT_152051 [Schizothecium conicum]